MQIPQSVEAETTAVVAVETAVAAAVAETAGSGVDLESGWHRKRRRPEQNGMDCLQNHRRW